MTPRVFRNICEWMQSGGTVRVAGADPGDLTFGCTTLELSKDARLSAENVHFGRPLTWQPESSIGEANVKDDARLTARNISTNNMRFRTEGRGRVSVADYDRIGRLETKPDGGRILLEKARPPQK